MLWQRYLFALWPNRVTHFLLWFVPRLRLPDYPLTWGGVCSIWMQNQAIYNTFISTTARWVFSYSFISSALVKADRSLTYFCNLVILWKTVLSRFKTHSWRWESDIIWWYLIILIITEKLPRQKTQRWEENMLIAISEKKRSSLAKWSEAHHEHANVSKSQEEKSFQLL